MGQTKLMLLGVFFMGTFCFGQNDISKSNLIEVLKKIETSKNVKFSYAVEDVRGIDLKSPSESFTIEETIDYLNRSTILRFKMLDERYITITFDKTILNSCGQVISKATGEPLFGATIQILNSSHGAISDTRGYFDLKELERKQQLEISYLGYGTVRIQSELLFTKDEACRVIVMEESTDELNEVVITKFLTTGIQKRLDGSIELNTSQFGSLPGLTEPDALQSIQILPGVESINESIANINVRGGTNDENLVLWDNIKMYHSGHFFGLISAYNPNLTSKVTITKNGTSSAYSDGVSSTINMSTKKNLSNKFSGGAGFDLISADAFLEIPISKKLELHVSGRRSFTDAFETPTFTRYFDRSFQDSDINLNTNGNSNGNSESDFFFYDYTAKLLFDLNDSHKFRAHMIGINNQLDYSETFDGNQENQSKSSSLSQDNLGFGVDWQGQWSLKFKTELIAYYSKYTIDAFDRRFENNQEQTQGNEVLETGIKLNARTNLSERLNLLIGYQLNETGILNSTSVRNPDFFRTKKDVLINHGLYAESEYKKDNTYLRAGVRLNYFQKFGRFIVEPRINFRQAFLQDFAINLKGEFKNQSASQVIDFQDDFLGVENRRWILANEASIPITTSQQASVGISYSKNNLDVEITGVMKEVSGITASNQGFYNNFQFLEASGDYTYRGLEVLLNKTGLNYSGWLGYNFGTNDYFFEDFDPSVFPNNSDIRHSVNLGINYSLFKKLELGVSGMWRSGSPYTQPREGNETVQSGSTTLVNYGNPNALNLDAFRRLDATVSYSFKLSKDINSKISLGFRNLTNEANIINRYYEVDMNDSNRAVRIDNKSLGFTTNFSFRLRF